MSSERQISQGWESVHQRLKKGQLESDERWRLRDWDSHPNDPGWENGTYSECHAELRSKVQRGDIVFDTVYVGRPTGDSPVIRSAFVVDDASDQVLSFSHYWFFDGEPIKGIRANMSRGHKRLDEAQAEEYMRQIEDSSAYTRYRSGEKPESVSQELWEDMINRAESDSGCPTCGGVGSSSSSDDDC